jgi:putative endonuclease
MSAAPVAQRRRNLGAYGEDLAVRWYLDRGFELLDRNWRCPQGEIDIVVAKDDVLVFSEVKTRTSDTFGEPFEAVGPAKQRRLRRLAGAWLRSLPTGVESRRSFIVRFDVVSVTPEALSVIEAAF